MGVERSLWWYTSKSIRVGLDVPIEMVPFLSMKNQANCRRLPVARLPRLTEWRTSLELVQTTLVEPKLGAVEFQVEARTGLQRGERRNRKSPTTKKWSDTTLSSAKGTIPPNWNEVYWVGAKNGAAPLGSKKKTRSIRCGQRYEPPSPGWLWRM